MRIFTKFSPFLLLLLSISLSAQPLDISKLKAMKIRNIGPAGMSGRVTGIDVVESNTNLIYVATASGGLWHSTNNGITWVPLFDKEKVLSIGAIKIQQSNPDVIWAGTGEGNPRNSQSSGAGIYKSLDGGRNWQLMGLELTRNIHRIVINRDNPDIVYVAALGSAWGDSKERGVFKTTNGGQSWEKILYFNEKSGCADLVVDPSNPNKLFAAMWEFRRQPWIFKSGGESSGLYVSYDAGKTWSKRTDKNGLPAGELGRIGVAVSKSNPKVVYATIESSKNALYRSNDGGVNWSMVNNNSVGDRPFYYAEIYCDPKNENTVYDIHTFLSRSIDGGKSFNNLFPYSLIHPDHHALWIDPNNPNFILEGNDGGMAMSKDNGVTWQFIENLPVAQFYHINYDFEFPYNVYGGLQDNGSWKGPSAILAGGGIRNYHWEEVNFGDGFDVVPDQNNNRFVYSMSQGGALSRYDTKTGAQNYIKPVHPDGVELRFNWNAGIAQDPFNKKTIYFGSQFLHKSTDEGENWELISPDLTTNDTTKQKQSESGGLTADVTGAENHTTILAIEPSAAKQGYIWVGTDDGNVQFTSDGGKTWTNTSKNMKEVPSGSWVPHIIASNTNENEAFVVVNNYRREDWTPYLMHTTDGGKTWNNIAKNKDIWGYCLSFAQDQVEPKLMFLGTEFGLYVSIDAGSNWTKWTNDYPSVSTMDMKIHPRDNDLIIGTFGRAIWILDDISPLREIAKNGINILDKTVNLFPIADAYKLEYKATQGEHFAGSSRYEGVNKSGGAIISFSTKKPSEDKTKSKDNEDKDTTTKEKPYKMSLDSARIEIFDIANNRIRTFRTKVDTGITKTYWGMDAKGYRYPTSRKNKKDDYEPGGKQIMPGKYKVKVTYNEKSDSGFVNVKFDPRLEITEAEIKIQIETAEKFDKKIALVTEAMDRLRDSKDALDNTSKKIELIDDTTKKDFEKLVNRTKDSVNKLIELLQPESKKQGIVRHANRLGEYIGEAYEYIRSMKSIPNTNVTNQIAIAEKKINEFIEKVNTFYTSDWKTFKNKADNFKLSIFKDYEKIKVE